MEKKINPTLSLILIAIAIDIVFFLLFWGITIPIYDAVVSMGLAWKIITLIAGLFIFTLLRYASVNCRLLFFYYAEKKYIINKRTVSMSSIIFGLNQILSMVALWIYAYRPDAIMIVELIVFTAIISIVNIIFNLNFEIT